APMASGQRSAMRGSDAMVAVMIGSCTRLLRPGSGRIGPAYPAALQTPHRAGRPKRGRLGAGQPTNAPDGGGRQRMAGRVVAGHRIPDSHGILTHQEFVLADSLRRERLGAGN